MRDEIAYIGLGSNQGDRTGTILRALMALDEQLGINVLLVSQLIDSSPVGGPAGQEDYLNGVAQIRCNMAPSALLGILQETEAGLGRERNERWGPRTIDLDLLLYAEAIIEEADLQVPHPQMHRRVFVLGPMVEIGPEVIHPGLGRTMRELLATLEGI